jgi:hypothetical protein
VTWNDNAKWQLKLRRWLARSVGQLAIVTNVSHPTSNLLPKVVTHRIIGQAIGRFLYLCFDAHEAADRARTDMGAFIELSRTRQLRVLHGHLSDSY